MCLVSQAKWPMLYQLHNQGDADECNDGDFFEVVKLILTLEPVTAMITMSFHLDAARVCDRVIAVVVGVRVAVCVRSRAFGQNPAKCQGCATQDRPHHRG